MELGIEIRVLKLFYLSFLRDLPETQMLKKCSNYAESGKIR
jgi:hypothetical protein